MAHRNLVLSARQFENRPLAGSVMRSSLNPTGKILSSLVSTTLTSRPVAPIVVISFVRRVCLAGGKQSESPAALFAERSPNPLPSETPSKGLLHWRVPRLVKRRIQIRSMRAHSIHFSHLKSRRLVAVIGR